jgi:hypothetical protein
MEKVYHSRTRKISSSKSVILAIVLPILLAACSAGTGGYTATSGGGNPPPPGGGGNPPPTQDTTPPSINITSPTTGPSYDTTNVSVTVSSTATDNVGLSQISWTNSKGGSGNVTVSGTSTNRNFNIALQSGANLITLTARDTSGNTAQKQLTVNYTPTTSNSASLAWDSVTAPNLTGYRVYYGTSSGIYSQPYGQGLSVGAAVSYTVMGLSSGTRYYFAVTAIDSLGNESAYSNEAFKDIP